MIDPASGYLRRKAIRAMESDQYLGWLALALTPGLGARMAGKLLQEFGSPEAIFSASLTALEARRLPAAVAQAIHKRQPLSDAAKELAQVQAAGCRLLTWDEPEYPQRLRARGVEIEQEFAFGNNPPSIYFRDPDGNVLELAVAGIWALETAE